MILKIIAISLMMMSSAVNAYNILVLAPFPYRSHWMVMESIIERLLDRDHYVIVISPFKYESDDYEDDRLKEIIIPKYPVEKIFASKDVFNGKYESDISYIQAQYKIGLAVSEHTLNQPSVQTFINRKEHSHFDVVLADSSHQDSLYMFAYKSGCPLISIDVNGNNNYLDEAMGIMTPYSFIPHPISKYENNMSYMQRCYNTLLYIFEAAVRKFSYMPAQNKLAQKHFRGGIDGQIPHIQDVVRNISAVLSNSFRVIQNRPKMASQFDVAGLHINLVQSLPPDLKDIIKNSERSVIYFSLGSCLKPSEMPKEKLNEIIKTFTRIKKTILWQYDGDIPAGLPDNVIIQKWFPQNDILANKRVVLFITQGGTLSYQEAIKNEIPMLIIPFTGEQYRNALRAQRGHFGEILLFDDLNEETLTKKIIQITNDNTYFTSINKASKKLFDSPVEPMKEAIFWVQHVCRHQGIEKAHSVNFSWFTYFSLDVAAFYIGILLTCIIFWVLTIKLIVRRYRNREQKGKFKYY